MEIKRGDRIKVAIEKCNWFGKNRTEIKELVIQDIKEIDGVYGRMTLISLEDTDGVYWGCKYSWALKQMMMDAEPEKYKRELESTTL